MPGAKNIWADAYAYESWQDINVRFRICQRSPYPSVWETYSGTRPLNETGEEKGVPISVGVNVNVSVSVNVTDGLGGIDQWRRQHHRLSAPSFEHVHEATDLTRKLVSKSHSFNNMSKSLVLRILKVSRWSIPDGHEPRYYVTQWYLWLRRHCTVDVSISFNIRLLFHCIETFLCTATWYFHIYVIHHTCISSCNYMI